MREAKKIRKSIDETLTPTIASMIKYLEPGESIPEPIRIEIGNVLQELYNLKKIFILDNFGVAMHSGDFGEFQEIKKDFLLAIKKDKKFNCFFEDVLGSFKKHLPENVAFVVAIYIVTALYNNDSNILDEKNINRILSNSGFVVPEDIKNNMKIIFKITKKRMVE